MGAPDWDRKEGLEPQNPSWAPRMREGPQAVHPSAPSSPSTAATQEETGSPSPPRRGRSAGSAAAAAASGVGWWAHLITPHTPPQQGHRQPGTQGALKQGQLLPPVLQVGRCGSLPSQGDP